MRMTSNWLEGNKTLIPCGKYSVKKSIWENEYLFWIMYTGVHSNTMWNRQRYCGQLHSHVWIANFRGRNETLPFPQNLRISSWSYDMEGHARECVQRYCELSNNTTQQLYKVSTPCIDDHHFKEEEMKSDGELSQLYSQIVLKCIYWAWIGRPDIL